MKLNSWLVAAFSVTTSIFSSESGVKDGPQDALLKSSGSLGCIEDDFVLVEADLKDSNAAVDLTTVYPKVSTFDGCMAEIDRINSHLNNGRMTEATTIDLLVLVYKLLGNQMTGELSPMNLVANEIFQLIVEIPDAALECVKVECACNVRLLYELHIRLIAAANQIDPGIYEAVEIKHTRWALKPSKPSDRTGEVKKIKGVLAFLDGIMAKADSPYHFLSQVSSNLNIRNYLRFFMCLYAVSLQCKYIPAMDHMASDRIQLLLYDATTAFLRAFPDEKETSEIAEKLSNLQNHSRMEIFVTNSELVQLEKSIKICISSGFGDAFSLLSSMDLIQSIYRKKPAEFMVAAVEHYQFRVFANMYKYWAAKFSVDERIIILCRATRKKGILKFINEDLVETFEMPAWRALIKSALLIKNYNVMKALFRISLLDNSIFADMELDLSSHDHNYFFDVRGNLLPERDWIEIYLMIPQICLVLPEMAQILANRARFNLKYALNCLIIAAQSEDHAKIEKLFTETLREITPYHFRKLMRHLDPKKFPVLVNWILSHFYLSPNYIEEAAYGALEALNLDLLEILVKSCGFQITETFARRWLVRNSHNSFNINLKDTQEFRSRFAEYIEPFINELILNGVV